MRDQIVQILKSKRQYEAEQKLLLTQNDTDISSGRQDRLSFLNHQLHHIDVWLVLLSEDESFVIKRHYFDGIDIPRIAVEYKQRWGEEFGKTERTIKKYQKKALEKIEQFELQNPFLSSHN